MSNSTIEWWRVEPLMLKSFRGQQLTELEAEFIREAYADDPEEYARRHTRVKGDEIERIRRC